MFITMASTHKPKVVVAPVKPGRATGECLGAGALLLVVLALEELHRTDSHRALVASLGWNQQAAAAMIERSAR